MCHLHIAYVAHQVTDALVAGLRRFVVFKLAKRPFSSAQSLRSTDQFRVDGRPDVFPLFSADGRMSGVHAKTHDVLADAASHHPLLFAVHFDPILCKDELCTSIHAVDDLALLAGFPRNGKIIGVSCVKTSE